MANEPSADRVRPDVPASFFVTDGDGYIGTQLARGPWDDVSAHGGPVAALIGREAERFDPDPSLTTVRLTIELLKPVPVERHLRVESTLLRGGKRVRLVGVSLFDDESADATEVARATVLRIVRTPDDSPTGRPEGPPTFDGPDASAGAPSLLVDSDRIGIPHGVELRTAGGSARDPGPATYWFRVHRALVDDEPISPLTRALIPADFGNGTSSIVSIDTHVFINPDLTVHLWRLPEGEWVAGDARTWLEPGGSSVAEALLYDREGPVGRAMQSLYIASR